MATQLNQVLTFTAVAGGAQQTQPHSINVNGLAVLPDLLFPSNDNFSFVSATTTTITVINNGTGAATLSLWCLLQHSIERSYGPSSLLHLTPQPFWVGGGVTGGGGGGAPIVVNTINNTSGATILAGSPVISTGTTTTDGDSTPIIGIAQVDTLAAQPMPIQTNGVLTLTTGAWDHITGLVGGLTPHAPYYVDANPMRITTAQPAPPNTIKLVGVALSATDLLLASIAVPTQSFGQFIGVLETTTGTGTWTPDPAARLLILMAAVGGGGGGGGANAAGFASAGQGGGTGCSFDVGAVGSTIPCIIMRAGDGNTANGQLPDITWTAGAPGIGVAGADGTDGGNSTLHWVGTDHAITITAFGGPGGAHGPASTGLGLYSMANNGFSGDPGFGVLVSAGHGFAMSGAGQPGYLGQVGDGQIGKTLVLLGGSNGAGNGPLGSGGSGAIDLNSGEGPFKGGDGGFGYFQVWQFTGPVVP